MDLRVLGALLGDDNAAEPVPVRRPGVCVTDADPLEEWTGMSTGSHIGKTNVGLNLGDESITSVCSVKPMAEMKTYRNTSHRISTQDTQLETIISPVLGFHLSILFADLLSEYLMVSPINTGTS